MVVSVFRHDIEILARECVSMPSCFTVSPALWEGPLSVTTHPYLNLYLYPALSLSLPAVMV